MKIAGAIVRSVMWIALAVILLGLMILSNVLCGSPPAPFRIVGWNGDALLYGDSQGRTFERGADGHFIRIDP